MKDSSDDEPEDAFIETNKTDPKAAKSQQAERAERLRKMMDDEGRLTQEGSRCSFRQNNKG